MHAEFNGLGMKTLSILFKFCCENRTVKVTKCGDNLKIFKPVGECK